MTFLNYGNATICFRDERRRSEEQDVFDSYIYVHVNFFSLVWGCQFILKYLSQIYILQVAIGYNLNPFLEIYNFLRVVKYTDANSWRLLTLRLIFLYLGDNGYLQKYLKNSFATFRYYIHLNHDSSLRDLIDQINKYLTQWISHMCFLAYSVEVHGNSCGPRQTFCSSTNRILAFVAPLFTLHLAIRRRLI